MTSIFNTDLAHNMQTLMPCPEDPAGTVNTVSMLKGKSSLMLRRNENAHAHRLWKKLQRRFQTHD